MITPRLKLAFSVGFFENTCFDLWSAHLNWLQAAGFEAARREEFGVSLGHTTGHEVVDLLDFYIARTGRVNAHLGLTSSDIVDNARLIALNQAVEIVADGVLAFTQEWPKQFAAHFGQRTRAFTHWQAAAPIDWEHRVRAWMAPLDILIGLQRPVITAKHFGGPVGDAASLKLVLGDKWDRSDFDWEAFDIAYPVNPWPLQSSDHLSEQAAVNWICALAAQLHKIAQDLRFLASHELVRPAVSGLHAGSSSMPHKLNPHKWEKVCSICRSVATTQQEMWSVAAMNGLERTLDTSWQIKSLLPRAFLGLGNALDELAAQGVLVTEGGTAPHLIPDSDRRLTERVIAGESRWSVYLEQLNHNQGKTT